MKLHQIVLFGILVLLVGVGIQFIHPKDGIRISNDLTLQLPSFEKTYLPEPKEDLEQQKAIAAILAEEEPEEEEEPKVSQEEQRRIDSLKAVQVQDSIRTWQLAIHYPNDDKSMLYKVYEALEGARNANRPVHILHYGDSQIEGDRMTDYIRHKIQTRFGGQGPGWLPTVPLVYPRSFIIKHSDNWKKAHNYGLRDTTVTHKNYGAMFIFGRFCPYPNDSIPNDTLKHEAWITYKRTSRSYDGTKSFRNFKLFYGFNQQPVTVKLYEKDSLIKEEILAPCSEVKYFKHSFNHNVTNVTLRFEGYDSPDLYHVSLDGNSGVEVSNIAMRGNSGTDFYRSPSNQLTGSFKHFNVKLLLLQYGGNVMPFAKTDKGVESYAHRFMKNIKHMKKLCPNAEIIVIGPSDMCKMEGTEWITYPMLTKVRDELKQASFDAGAAYWDLYEAMGGNGAMKEWVEAEKPLAIKDYTHFTNRGVRKAGQWFFNALIKDFHEYEANKE